PVNNLVLQEIERNRIVGLIIFSCKCCGGIRVTSVQRIKMLAISISNRIRIDNTQIAIFVIQRKKWIALQCQASDVTFSINTFRAVMYTSKAQIHSDGYLVRKFLSNI